MIYLPPPPFLSDVRYLPIRHLPARDVDNILTIVGNTKLDDTSDIRPVPGVKISF